MTTAQLTFGDIRLDVKFKDIKNVHLSVHPPKGDVTIAAPARMSLETVRAFAATKIGWIRRQQRKLREARKASVPEYLERESHYLWGRRYLLRIEPTTDKYAVFVASRYLTLQVPKDANAGVKAAVLSKWYRRQLLAEVPSITLRWAAILCVTLPVVRVRQMKTKWGSCNHRTGSILINSELAKKPKKCLEYILLHEMTHLIESTHNEAFTTIMDNAMPNWQITRDLLNALATPHREQRCFGASLEQIVILKS